MNVGSRMLRVSVELAWSMKEKLALVQWAVMALRPTLNANTLMDSIHSVNSQIQINTLVVDVFPPIRATIDEPHSDLMSALSVQIRRSYHKVQS